MNINLIISALDGTLLHTNEERKLMNTRVIKKINYLTTQDVKVSIDSGRHHLDIANVAKHFGLQNINYYIGCNGSIIYDAKSKEIIKAHYLESNNFKKAINVSNFLDHIDLKFVVAGYTKTTDLYIIKNESLTTNGYDYFKKIESEFTDYKYLEVDSIPNEAQICEFKITLDQENSFTIYDVYHKIENAFIDCSMFITGKYSIVVLAKEIDKGSAIKDLNEILGNELNTLSIGNSINDIEMFKATKYSATWSKCDPKVTKKATHVVEGESKKWVNEALDFFFDIPPKINK